MNCSLQMPSEGWDLISDEGWDGINGEGWDD